MSKITYAEPELVREQDQFYFRVWRDTEKEGGSVDEEQLQFRVPAKFEVCERCDGKGKHDHPAFSNGITSSEWDGPDWDDESRENYMSGVYDVPCERCNGERVELVPQFDLWTPPPEIKALFKQWQREKEDYQRELAEERRMREAGIEF